MGEQYIVRAIGAPPMARSMILTSLAKARAQRDSLNAERPDTKPFRVYRLKETF